MREHDISIGDTLAALRKARSLSLDQLSRDTGVSKSMLRQVEIGRSSPTISVLWKIANGLRVPFTTLLAGRTAPAQVTDFTGGGVIRSGKRGYRLYPLVPFEPARPLEVYYAEMDPGVRFDGEPHQGDARETVLVMEGSLEVETGAQTLAAVAGQAVQFLAGQPHRYANTGRIITRLVMTIDYSA
jgi:transcriptional regulator with XRE-family HTH domain